MVTDALQNVISRLVHMRRHWEDASRHYFHPDRFLIALQGCITTGRTVTFILQSNKASIPGFEEWYPTYQKRWSEDPVMVWARDARNAIEKRGDLETFSQIKCRIVASYLGGPETDWMPQALFLKPIQVFLAVPARYRSDSQIKDHGTLIIERRWIDRNLPTIEVLDALSHVYIQLVEMLADLHERLGVDVPDLLTGRLPVSMQPLIMDRAIYLSMKSGTEVGFRIYQEETTVNVQKLRKRYGKDASWEKLASVTYFEELCDVMFAHARILTVRDSHHHSFAILVSNLKFLRVIGINHPDRASRYVLMRELAELAKVIEADGVIIISEAWTAQGKDLPASGYAVEAEKRGEALTMIAANSRGETYSYQAEILRKKKKKHKIKNLSTTHTQHGTFMFILAPFQEAWGCLDQQKLEEAVAEVDKIADRQPIAEYAVERDHT